MALTDASRTPNHSGDHWWRGRVDEKLDALSNTMDLFRSETKTDIQTLADKIDKLERGMGNGGSPYVTWTYLREKFAVPLVLAMITFTLFTIMPLVIIVIYVILGRVP